MRRIAQALGWLAMLALQLLVARTYWVRGTWWHWLLHVPIGLGVGLAVAALIGLARQQPALPWMLMGQLVSIVPDLAFRFLRMPHEASMDLWVGHISVHRGPSPVLVALAVLLLGGWAFVAGRQPWGPTVRRPVVAMLAVGSLGLLLVACAQAAPLPIRLSQF